MTIFSTLSVQFQYDVIMGEEQSNESDRKNLQLFFANEHRAKFAIILSCFLCHGNQKNDGVLQPGPERPDSQANSARKAGWSFPIV
jgi:hypothetical protein